MVYVHHEIWLYRESNSQPSVYEPDTLTIRPISRACCHFLLLCRVKVLLHRHLAVSKKLRITALFHALFTNNHHKRSCRHGFSRTWQTQGFSLAVCFCECKVVCMNNRNSANSSAKHVKLKPIKDIFIHVIKSV